MATSKVKLPFGLSGERLLSISEVDRGLACACVCPACQQPLVARKGRNKVHHFSHYRGLDCGFGLESALHYQAKRVLDDAGRMMVPAVYLANHRKPVFPARMIYFDELRMEQRAGQLVPDLMLRTGRRWLLVEIAVTHPCGEEKIRRIRDWGLAALEVDLQDLQKDFHKTAGSRYMRQLTKHLIWQQKGKTWLYNPRRNVLEAELRRQATPRKVHYRRYHDKHLYTVRPCPARRRLWEVNAFQRFTYARVFQDCLHCPYCLEIRYQTAWRAGREVPTLPEKVWCWGDQPDLLEALAGK